MLHKCEYCGSRHFTLRGRLDCQNECRRRKDATDDYMATSVFTGNSHGYSGSSHSGGGGEFGGGGHSSSWDSCGSGSSYSSSDSGSCGSSD